MNRVLKLRHKDNKTVISTHHWPIPEFDLVDFNLWEIYQMETMGEIVTLGDLRGKDYKSGHEFYVEKLELTGTVRIKAMPAENKHSPEEQFLDFLSDPKNREFIKDSIDKIENNKANSFHILKLRRIESGTIFVPVPNHAAYNRELYEIYQIELNGVVRTLGDIKKNEIDGRMYSIGSFSYSGVIEWKLYECEPVKNHFKVGDYITSSFSRQTYKIKYIHDIHDPYSYVTLMQDHKIGKTEVYAYISDLNDGRYATQEEIDLFNATAKENIDFKVGDFIHWPYHNETRLIVDMTPEFATLDSCTSFGWLIINMSAPGACRHATTQEIINYVQTLKKKK